MGLVQVKDHMQYMICEYEAFISKNPEDFFTCMKAMAKLSDCYRRLAIAFYHNDFD